MSILASLRTEHDAFLRAADRWEDGEIDDRDFLESVRELVRVHFRDEEQILYPELPDLEGRKSLAAYIREHRAVATLADRAEDALSAGNGRVGRDATAHSLLAEALQSIKHHIRDEEEELFQTAQDYLSPEKLREFQGRRHECSCRGH